MSPFSLPLLPELNLRRCKRRLQPRTASPASPKLGDRREQLCAFRQYFQASTLITFLFLTGFPRSDTVTPTAGNLPLPPKNLRNRSLQMKSSFSIIVRAKTLRPVFCIGCGVLLLLLAAAVPSRADEPAISFTGTTVNGTTGAFSLGFEFTTNNAIDVSALGFYNASLNLSLIHISTNANAGTASIPPKNPASRTSPSSSRTAPAYWSLPAII